MICGTCGAELMKGDAFCPECGTKAEAAQPPKPPAKPAPTPPPPPVQQKAEQPAPQAGGKNVRFCGDCGTEMLEGDIFCPECGAKAEGAAQPQPPAKKQKAPKPPKKEKAAAVKKSAEGEKKNKPMALILVLVIVALAAVAYFAVIRKPAAPEKPAAAAPKKTAAGGPQARGPAKAGAQDIARFADRICRMSTTMVQDVDGITNFEFIALMAADSKTLESKNYTTDEYLAAVVPGIKKSMADQGYEPCAECNVVSARDIDCNRMYGDMGKIVVSEGLAKSGDNVSAAGRDMGVTDCGVIVLEQKWPGADAPAQVAYFTGSAAGKKTILFYTATNFYANAK